MCFIRFHLTRLLATVLTLQTSSYYVKAQSLTLNGPLGEGNVCPYEEVVFTCTTRGSSILEWTSDHYIGSGGERLQLLSVNCRTTEVRSTIDPNTIATCLSVTQDNNVTIIVSELRITVSAEFMTSTVNCSNNGLGTSDSITFHVQGQSKVVLNSSLGERNVVYPQQIINFTCTTRRSSILEWSSDHYIGSGGERLQLLSVNCQTTEVRSTIDPNTIATCLSVTQDNNVTIIVSELRISVSAEFMTSTVNCSNNGLGTSDSITFHVQDITDEYPTTTDSDTVPVSTYFITAPSPDDDVNAQQRNIAVLTITLCITAAIIVIMTVLTTIIGVVIIKKKKEYEGLYTFYKL